MKPEELIVSKITDREELTKQIRIALENMKNVNPDKVMCMLGLIVSESPTNEDGQDVHAFMLGSNGDIAQMLMVLAQAAKEGIESEGTNKEKEEVLH